MDKLNCWLLALVMLLNVILAIALSVLVMSGPFRDDTQDNTVRLLTQLNSELRDGKKVLSPSEQARLVTDFQFVVKARAEAQAAGTKMMWAIIQAIVLALILQAIVLFRVLRNRSGLVATASPNPLAERTQR